MTYDLHSDAYFRPDALERDMRRIYEICSGCRRCAELCPAFALLFDAADHSGDGRAGDGRGIAALDENDLAGVVDLCFNCRRCSQACPYTPPHEAKVDFPRLMLRAKAVEATQRGRSLGARVLARPDIIGRVASFGARAANAINATAVGRVALEKSVGVHRDYNLPAIAGQSFAAWFQSATGRRERDVDPIAKVALFYTCRVNHYAVETGKALVRVLWHNRIEVVAPPQVCCGRPSLDYGDIDGCRRQARQNVRALGEWVDAGYDIVTPEPTCGLMLREDYPDILATDAAMRVAERTYDACELLMALHGVGKLRTEFARGCGRVAYHFPCHLSAQRIGAKSRDLLTLLPDTEVRMVNACAAVDGTWGMRVENFDIARAYAEPLLASLRDDDTDVYASDCAQARQQIIYGTGKPAYHPLELIADAYGLRSGEAPALESRGPAC